jgi:hypothetical protein
MDYEKIAASVTVPGAQETEQGDAPAEAEITAEGSAQAVREFYPVDHPKYQGLAAAKGYDQSNPLTRLQSLRYTHEAMIDVIIAQPAIKQNELAKMFDKSVPWISRIIGSDAFQAALAKRREELTDPFLVATIEERFKGLAMQSIDILAEKLQLTQNADLALKALDVSAKSLGFGARNAGPGQTNQFIIQLPPKAANASEWAEAHGPMKQLPSEG